MKTFMKLMVLSALAASPAYAAKDACKGVKVKTAKGTGTVTRSAEAGDLKLDELVSRRLGFDQVNEAMDATRRGEGLRNVVMIGAEG